MDGATYPSGGSEKEPRHPRLNDLSRLGGGLNRMGAHYLVVDGFHQKCTSRSMAQAMKLYEVICWGGAGVRDTIYLVRAPDFHTAAAEVRTNASRSDHGGKPPLPDAIYEIGVETTVSPQEVPKILRGPYVQSAYNHGWQQWYRQDRGGAADVWTDEIGG